MATTRREALTGITIAAPALLMAAAGRRASAAGPATKPAPGGAAAPPAFAGQHQPVPLPFDPKRLAGISERMIVSHHENNYASAIKNLNRVEEQLASLGRDTPGFVVAGLKERELAYANSATLHEHYFGNLGGSGKPGGAIEKRLAAGYGSLGRWEENFRALGQSLGGGSGWAIVDFSFQTGDARTFFSGNHTQARASAVPLLVMDMYEHAYALDFGAGAGKYIDAFFANVNWDEVNRRLERAEKAAAVLRT
jgi:Fe-Mn family superoxide dismutase